MSPHMGVSIIKTKVKVALQFPILGNSRLCIMPDFESILNPDN